MPNGRKLNPELTKYQISELQCEQKEMREAIRSLDKKTTDGIEEVLRKISELHEATLKISLETTEHKTRIDRLEKFLLGTMISLIVFSLSIIWKITSGGF